MYPAAPVTRTVVIPQPPRSVCLFSGHVVASTTRPVAPPASVRHHASGGVKQMPVTNLGHVAIRCRNLDESLAFYAKLGLHEAFRLRRDDGSVNLVYVQINDHAFLELFPGGSEAAEASRTRTG